jgi:antitoxin YefM
METISYSAARDNLKAVIDRAVDDHVPVAIVRQRGEGAVLVSASDWASIQETLYLLSSPKNARRLLDSIDRLNRGEGIEMDDLPKPG